MLMNARLSYRGIKRAPFRSLIGHPVGQGTLGLWIRAPVEAHTSHEARWAETMVICLFACYATVNLMFASNQLLSTS